MVEQPETTSAAEAGAPATDTTPHRQFMSPESRFGIALGASVVVFFVLVLLLSESSPPVAPILGFDNLVALGSPPRLRAWVSDELLKEDLRSAAQESAFYALGKVERGAGAGVVRHKTISAQGIDGKGIISAGEVGSLSEPGVYVYEVDAAPKDARTKARVRAAAGRIYIQALASGQKVVLVDVESALAKLTGRAFEQTHALDMGAVPGAARVLSGFHDAGRAIGYIYRGAGGLAIVGKVHRWLEANGFPAGAVLIPDNDTLSQVALVKDKDGGMVPQIAGAVVEFAFGKIPSKTSGGEMPSKTSGGVKITYGINKGDDAPWGKIEDDTLYIWGRAK